MVTQSLAEVPAAIDRLLDQGAAVLAINGGDGTLGAAIAHLEKLGISIPLVPVLGGTNNAVAKDAGARGHIDHVLPRITKDAPTVSRNTLRITKNGEPLGVGFIFATGLIVRFTEAYYAGPWYGPPQAARVVAERLATSFLPNQRDFWRFEATRIELDGETFPGASQLAFLSTIDTQILFFKPFKTAAGQLQGFNALVNALPAHAIIKHLWPIARGNYDGPGHWTREVQRVSITGTPKVFLDGELHTVNATDIIEVTTGPRVRFLQL